MHNTPLTEQELYKIFSWQPYRADWPVNMNERIDNIDTRYGRLTDRLKDDTGFSTYQTGEGGMGNYLEFLCYPAFTGHYKGSCILVCVSLCCPFAAYGQTTLTIEDNFIGWGGIFKPETTSVITDASLTEVARAISTILQENDVHLLNRHFASKYLPDEVAESIKLENHNEGVQYLHGIFQKND